MLNAVTTEHLNELQSRLPATVFGVDPVRYLEDPRRILEGKAKAVLRPSCVQDVSKIVGYANEHRLPIVPYSGGTGLVGGQIYPDVPEPLVISTERLNSIRSVWPSENVLVCDAGVTLSEVQLAAEQENRNHNFRTPYSGPIRFDISKIRAVF